METINVAELELPIYDHNTILELSADPRSPGSSRSFVTATRSTSG